MSGIYDVIIIGAGPGGLACALELKDSGKSVLVLEKNDVIGPKVCAGGLKNLDPNFKLPEGKFRSFPKEFYTTKYKSYELDLVKPLRTVSRHDLGQHQYGLLEGAANIEVKTGVKVLKIHDGQIETSAGKLSFKNLVGADGSNSLVRRHLGLPTESCIGMYYDVPVVTDKVVWHFNPEAFGTGYVWSFPHLASTNIGIFFNPEHMSPKNAKKALHDWLDAENIDYAGSLYQAAAISHSYQGCEFGNVFLIGDAAGLALRTNGAGISFAIISGREIARRIANPDYKMKELDIILRYKKKQENLFMFIEKIKFIQRPAFRMLLNLMKKRWFQKYFGSYF